MASDELLGKAVLGGALFGGMSQADIFVVANVAEPPHPIKVAALMLGRYGSKIMVLACATRKPFVLNVKCT